MDYSNSNDFPKLIEYYKKIREDLNLTEAYGYKLQDIGRDIVGFAKTGKEVCGFFDMYAPTLTSLTETTPELQGTVHQAFLSAYCAHNNLEQANKTLENTIATYGAGTTVIASATVMAVSGYTNIVSDVTKLQRTGVISQPISFKKVEHSHIQNKLSEYLTKIDIVLENKRKGAWETLNTSTIDKHSQAANSLRTVLRALINKWASNEAVINAEWWVATTEKETPTTRQRYRFLIYGNKSDYPEQELISIENNISRYTAEDRSIHEIAHGSKGIATDEELIDLMRAIETTMLEIITAREKSQGAIQ